MAENERPDFAALYRFVSEHEPVVKPEYQHLFPLTFPDAYARVYCGSYQLVRRSDGKLFRSNIGCPTGYTVVADAHDADGFLHPQHWSLPRLTVTAES